MEGFFNQIYLIDLTEQRFEVQSIPDDVYTRSLGGKGLGTYLLLRETDIPPRDPFDPKNPVILAIGPAAGLRIHGSSRYGVYTRSPQTGIYSESYFTSGGPNRSHQK